MDRILRYIKTTFIIIIINEYLAVLAINGGGNVSE